MKINFKNKTFSFFLVLSLSFHFLVILALIASKSLPNLFKKDKNLLIQNTIRIDTIGLPDLPSKPKVKKTKQKAVLVKKAKKNKEKKKKEKQAQKKKKEKRSQAQKNMKKNTSPSKNEQLNKGNKLSQGTKIGKETLTAQQISVGNIYINQVINQISAQWNLPKYLTDKNLSTQVVIKINKQGHVIDTQILISSGNELFDSLVLKAIENSGPYPAPPADIQKLIKDGIVPTFNSKN